MDATHFCEDGPAALQDASDGLVSAAYLEVTADVAVDVLFEPS